MEQSKMELLKGAVAHGCCLAGDAGVEERPALQALIEATGVSPAPVPQLTVVDTQAYQDRIRAEQSAPGKGLK